MRGVRRQRWQRLQRPLGEAPGSLPLANYLKVFGEFCRTAGHWHCQWQRDRRRLAGHCPLPLLPLALAVAAAPAPGGTLAYVP
jgi:hypothetical protein